MVAPDTLRQHLRLVHDLFDVIPLSEWLERKARQQPLPAKACVITFDDGWADNHEYAFPILRESATPATIFLVSDMIGTRGQFWPERLARLLTMVATQHADKWSDPALAWLQQTETGYAFAAAPPNTEELTRIIAAIKIMPDREIHARLDTMETVLGLDTSRDPVSLLSWKQVREMLDSGLVEVGSHTCHHVRLDVDTPMDLMQREITTSQTVIENNTGKPVKTFCFPNGDFSPAALDLVRQHYIGAVTTQSGWNTGTTDNYLLARIGIHDDITRDRTAFLARLSGWV